MTQPWRSYEFGLDGAVGGPVATVFRIENSSQVGEVRRAGEALSAALGMSENERGSLAIIITEVATNLARHATGGRVLLSRASAIGAIGVDVMAIDDGPGIMNIGRAMEDGYSSAGTSGHGLGAIRRLASTFDIYSRTGDRAGCGTILAATMLAAAPPRVTSPATTQMHTGAVCVSFDGGRVCGDAWMVRTVRDRTLVVVVDGLGHGPEAALASSEAIRVIGESPDGTPSQLVELAHVALRPTRGAALAVANVNVSTGVVDFAGIGNISVSLQGPDGTSRSLASLNGTVGHAIRRVQEFRYEWPAGGMLVTHTDGITGRWRADSYPGLLRHHPQLVAGALYRDALRGRDDATVVALSEQPS
jgi:anti-sigma regulatory factor (Ser/Thr protein kinase)